MGFLLQVILILVQSLLAARRSHSREPFLLRANASERSAATTTTLGYLGDLLLLLLDMLRETS